MEYIAFNQHKFASVIENINKELQVKGEGKVCYFPLFILLQHTSENALQYLCNTTGISVEFCTLLGFHWHSNEKLNRNSNKIIPLTMEFQSNYSTDSGIPMKAFQYQWNSHERNPLPVYSKTCLKRPLKNRQNKGLKDRW